MCVKLFGGDTASGDTDAFVVAVIAEAETVGGGVIKGFLSHCTEPFRIPATKKLKSNIATTVKYLHNTSLVENFVWVSS